MDFTDIQEITYAGDEKDSPTQLFKRRRNRNLTKAKTPFNYTSEVFILLGCLEYGDVNRAREIALNPKLLIDNPRLAENGKLIKLCLEKELTEFACELVNFGYKIPDDILLSAIKHKKACLIQSILTTKLFLPESIELEFWYLLANKFYTLAEMLQSTEVRLSIYDLADDISPNLSKIAIQSALERGYDDLASLILSLHPEVLDLNMIETAISSNNLEFLKKVWTGRTTSTTEQSLITTRQYNNVLWRTLNGFHDERRKKNLSRVLDICYILKYLLRNKLIAQARSVITWPEAADEKDILMVCIEMREEELARDLIKQRKKMVSRNDFHVTFQEKLFWVCLDMLKWSEPRACLNLKLIQSELVSMLAKGETCYFAAELLNGIKPSFWHAALSRRLCDIVNFSITKTQEILKCFNPLLYIAILAEFLLNISKLYPFYRVVCEGTIKNLLFLGTSIQDNISEENDLKKYLCYLDRKGRSVIEIIAENGFYSMLENKDLGSIVGNLWQGERKHSGILNASSLYKSFISNSKSEEKLLFLSKAELKDSYLFQYEQLVSSCELRFVGQIISTVLLVYFYTMLLYTATLAHSLDDMKNDPKSEGFLRVSQVWIFGLFIEKLLSLIFLWKTSRSLILDFWLINDILITLLTIFLASGLNEKYIGPGKVIDSITLATYNACMHGLVLCLIWLRLFSVLLTSSTYGPLLQIIYSMSKDLVSFLMVFFVTIFISSSMMSVLFHQSTSTNKFSKFGDSFQSMFTLSLGGFDLSNYTTDLAFGAVTEAVLVLILNILLLNMLIAILSATYERETPILESKFRKTLITAYSKWKWDSGYGILILLPPPLSVFTIAILPFLLFSKNPEKLTTFFSRFIFLFYAIPIFSYFSAASALFVVVIYLTSLEMFARSGTKRVKIESILQVEEEDDDLDEEYDDEVVIKGISYKRGIVWVLVGWAFCIKAYLSDLLRFWKILYQRLDVSIVKEEFLESNPEILTLVQHAISTFSNEDINLDELLLRFNTLQEAHMSTIAKHNSDHLLKREKQIRTFFENFLYSKKHLIIKKSFIHALVPPQSFYSNRYIDRLRCIKLQYINKGLLYFKKNSKCIEIENIMLPKSFLTGETFQIKSVLQTTKALLKSVEAETQKYTYLKKKTQFNRLATKFNY